MHKVQSLGFFGDVFVVGDRAPGFSWLTGYFFDVSISEAPPIFLIFLADSGLYSKDSDLGTRLCV